MNDQLIAAIVHELAPALKGRIWGKVWQLTRASLAVDFRLSDHCYLFISVEPNQPRLHLIKRTVRELEKQSLPPSNFLLTLRKQLGGARLVEIVKDEQDRIVHLSFMVETITGEPLRRTLIAQLTGRAANLLLLDEHGQIIDALRTPRGRGQEAGELYQPPPRDAGATHQPSTPLLTQGSFASLSEAADDHYRRLEVTSAFDQRAAAHLGRLRQAIEKRRKLARNLETDLNSHGDAEEHKRIGDLLLANIATAERAGARVRLIDYYAEGMPSIELEINENATLQEEAARRFARYTKAKRAAQEIAARLEQLRAETSLYAEKRAELESIINARDESALEDFDERARAGKGLRKPSEKRGTTQTKSYSKPTQNVPGARRYLSSDNYEILVGRTAKDNDQLTFKVARAHDVWLHAADYPGSHVIVRNPTRAEVPHRTVIEAAQLAAYFSQAKRDAKVAVHYTTRKFLSKPKGAAAGLVRMSSFRSLLVEPRESIERL